jgi:hypothetical protein
METGIENVKIRKARCSRTDVPVIIREYNMPFPSRKKHTNIENGRDALSRTKNLSVSAASVIASVSFLRLLGDSRLSNYISKTDGI